MTWGGGKIACASRDTRGPRRWARVDGPAEWMDVRERKATGVRLFSRVLVVALAVGPVAETAADAGGPAPWRFTEAAQAQSAASDQLSWRLSRALDLPEWLELGGHHRSRYETLDGQFRISDAASDRIAVFRTALRTSARFDRTGLVLEVIDSREQLADQGTPLNNGMVNTLALLQAYVAVELRDLMRPGSVSRVRIGRQTMDVGSRRLVARNRFRNTINHFTGIHGSWTAPSGATLQAFGVLPVDRLPSDRDRLLDNDAARDREDFDVQFWGWHVAFPGFVSAATGEMYLFGLHEDDGPDRATRNRRTYTAGFRLSRRPASGHVNFGLESALQTGESRASSAGTDTADLDHLAHFQHLHVGYTIGRPWSPRLEFLLDWASGDGDPSDGNNNRFDTLYGARRFELGPTGIYGAFARGNLLSPGYRLNLKPDRNLGLMVAHRFYWMASDRDAWTTSGVRDDTGGSGRHLGNQAEVRIRWELFPGNLRLEAGAARLLIGGFVEDAPGATVDRDPTFAYMQAALTY